MEIPGLTKVLACQARREWGKRKVECYTEWQKIGKGYFHARSDVSYGRFVEMVRQLRVR